MILRIKKNAFIILIMIGNISFSQSIDTLKFESKFKNVIYKNNQNITFNQVILDSNKTKRDTPENFVMSYLSAQNLAAFQSHRISPSGFMTEEDVKKNFELRSKSFKIIITDVMNYMIDTTSYCVIKFYQHNTTCVYQLKKINGQWFHGSSPEGTQFDLFLFRFNPIFCRDFYVNRHTGISFIDELITKNTKNDVFYYEDFITDFSISEIKAHKAELLSSFEKNH